MPSWLAHHLLDRPFGQYTHPTSSVIEPDYVNVFGERETEMVRDFSFGFSSIELCINVTKEAIIRLSFTPYFAYRKICVNQSS